MTDEQVAELEAAIARATMAGRKVNRILSDLFKPGQPVRWKTARGNRRGYIIEVSGGRIRASDGFGKASDVTPDQLISYAKSVANSQT